MKTKPTKSKKDWDEKKAWQRYIYKTAPVKIVKPVLIRKADKVMEAENEFHKGRAVWYFEIGTWACKQADDCLKFLMKKDVATAKRELLLRGFKWKWLDAAEKPEKGGAIAV